MRAQMEHYHKAIGEIIRKPGVRQYKNPNKAKGTHSFILMMNRKPFFNTEEQAKIQIGNAA